MADSLFSSFSSIEVTYGPVDFAEDLDYDLEGLDHSLEQGCISAWGHAHYRRAAYVRYWAALASLDEGDAP